MLVSRSRKSGFEPPTNGNMENIGSLVMSISRIKRKKVLKSKPIHERRALPGLPYHTNKAEILNEEGKPACPIVWGVDFIVTPELGASLYYMLKAYMKTPFTLGLTLEFPVPGPKKKQKDPVCKEKTTEWYFAVNYKVDCELLVGGKVNPPGVDGYEGKSTQDRIKSIMDAYKAGQPPDIKDFSADIEFSPFGKPFNVIPKTPLGLFKLPQKVIPLLNKQCCKKRRLMLL